MLRSFVMPQQRHLQCPGPAGILTLGPARLQALLFRVEVVAVAQTASVEEGFTGHGGGVVEEAGEHPAAGPGVPAQPARVCGPAHHGSQANGSAEQGGPDAAPSPGTYLPYCRCKWAGVLQLSPPPGAGLLSVPSAPVRKHRAAISPCLWDLLPTPLPPGWAVSGAPQAPALCAPSTSPVTDLGSAGCDPSTPHDLPSPVTLPGWGPQSQVVDEDTQSAPVMPHARDVPPWCVEPLPKRHVLPMEPSPWAPDLQ